MKLKTKFNKCRRLAILSVLWASAAGSAARAEDGIWYRDGDAWVEARRRSVRSERRQVVTLRRGERVSRAIVGDRAILQLSAAVRASGFLRAQGLRAVAPPGRRISAAEGALSSDGVVEPLALNPRLRLYLVESERGEDGLAIAARLSAAREVELVTPDLYLERRATEFAVPPNDPRYRGQWYLSRLKLERAWRVTAGDPAVTVVIVDNGCDMDHPDLAGQIIGGFDAIDDDDDASYSPGVEGNEHGTACAGVVAAAGNNGVGIAGTCPQCTLRCVRLFDRNHSLVAISSDVAAFNYAFDTGAAVVSNSWGFAEPQPVAPVLRSAIVELLDRGRGGRGAVVVFAAGNENRPLDDREITGIPGVLNVGAINTFDELAPFSNFGNSISLTAPTGSLTTDITGSDGADPSDYSSLFGGTSSSCPVVAGVSALMLSVAPERTGRELTDLLISTARDAPFAVPDERGHDKEYGFGIIDPVAALQALGFDVPEPPPMPIDAGRPDEGRARDAGERDGGGDDEPAADGGERDSDSDSGCASVPVGSNGSALVLVAWIALSLAFVRRRR